MKTKGGGKRRRANTALHDARTLRYERNTTAKAIWCAGGEDTSPRGSGEDPTGQTGATRPVLEKSGLPKKTLKEGRSQILS